MSFILKQKQKSTGHSEVLRLEVLRSEVLCWWEWRHWWRFRAV